jgi:hypothetical protein
MRDHGRNYPATAIEHLSLDKQLRHSLGAIQLAIDAFLQDSCAETLVTLLAESHQLEVVLHRFLEYAPRAVLAPDPPEHQPAHG